MAEKKVIELEIDSNLGNLKEQLNSARQSVQDLAIQFGASSKEVADAADQVRALEKEIKQTSKTLKSIGIEGKFNAITGSITGVLNGFQAVQGSLGVLGIESKNVEEALLKVQSAMALADGVEGIFRAQTSFKKLKDIAVNSFQGMTTASKAFAATGIGLLITAVGLLVANMDDIKKSFNSGLASAQKYAETTEKQAEAARHAVDNFDEYARTLRRVGFEEDEINNKRKAAFAKAIKDTENQLKAQQKVLSESKKGLETAQAFDSFGLNATGRWLYGDEEDVKANKTKAKEIAGQLTKLKNDQYEFNAELKKAQEEEKKKKEEDAKALAKENADKRREALEQIRKNQREATDLFKSEYEIQVRDIKEKYDAEIALAKKYNQSTIDLEKARKKELQDLEDKQIDTTRLGLEKVDLLKASSLNKTKAFQEQEKKGLVGVAENRQRLYEYEKAIEDKKKKNQEDALTATANTLGQIADLFGKQTAAGKAAAVAEATIQMFLSAQKAYTSTIGIPVVGPVLAPINAGLAIAAGIKNIKAITAIKVPNDTGSNPSPATTASQGSSIMSPNFNVVGNSGINQLAQLQQTPTKAYVVSGDVTTAQSLDRNRIENATLVQ
jgi:chromosome segregation ATPase